jgi:hypothetical protein
MSSDYDATEFIDSDFQAQRSAAATVTSGSNPGSRAPSREEVDSRVVEAQQKLAELKRAQEQLERERAGLEETRRRQMEFQTGRQEMLQNLTRGLGLLEEAEFKARQDAEQIAKSSSGLREALTKIESIHEETWNKDNFGVELTRALTALENGRMEWNSARLKYPVLSAPVPEPPTAESAAQQAAAAPLFADRSFGDLCRIGFALTWPVALTLAALGGLLIVLLRR